MYGVKHPCRYLVNLSDGTTECAVYENRLWTVLHSYTKGDKIISIVYARRESQKVNYIGCAINEKKNITVEEQFKITR